MFKTLESKFELVAFVMSSFKVFLQTSPNRNRARIFFLGAIFCVVAGVALTSVFSWWMNLFFGALTTMNASVFYSSLLYFILIASAGVILDMLNSFFMSKLIMDWRNWFTKELIIKFTRAQGNNFLKLARNADKLDNPEQRIQQDTSHFVDMSVNLGLDFLKSLLKLGTFIGTLWVVGGSLSFTVSGALIVIPGFLVWSALLFSGLGSYLSYLIGKMLPFLNKQKIAQEAELRKEMELLVHDAESIKLERGEEYYSKKLIEKMNHIREIETKQAKINIYLAGFQSIYYRLASVFPFIIAAPLYFMGFIDMGQLMQISFAFDMVNDSLSWFIESYSELSKYQTSVRRIMELEAFFSQKNATSITIKNADSTGLMIDKLSLATPKDQSLIIKGVTICLNEGEHVLVEGVSGLGKSTIFKAIAGSWTDGSGEIILPKDKKIAFLAQRPSIPNASLKEILAYPLEPHVYTPAQYMEVLEDVKLSKFYEMLNSNEPVKGLSSGEQQRIAFARALLQKPDWLFLDESTASLDPKTESTMYEILKQRLPQITLVSIAHKETLKPYHEKVIKLVGKLEDSEAIIEQTSLPQQLIA